MKLVIVGPSGSMIQALSAFLIKITLILGLANNCFAYYAPADYWYDFGYASGKLSMPPSGTGRIDDWHKKWPGHSDMYLTPSSCSYHGQGLRINCSSTSCGGGFTCKQELRCLDGSVAEGNLCNGGSPKVIGTPNPSTCDGNPCDASSGNKFQSEVDYTSNTLNFVRYYNSLVETQSVLGKRWTHDYLTSLSIGINVQANRHDGKVLEFHNDAANWVSDADITETLTQLDTLWEFKTSDDSIEIYNNIGQLLSITTRNGKLTQYSYNENGLLQQVTGPYGRHLSFTYNASDQLTTLTTPDNNQVHYAYDVNNNLVSVTYPDNTTKLYHYENVNFLHHLTGITDENGHRYATYAYNDEGLVILSEHADGVETVGLVYNADETTTVTDALGRVKIYSFESQYGLRKPSSIQYDYHDGNQAVTKTKTYTYYPDNGQVQEVIDYNGNITYFEYNNRGLITLKTQARGTPEEMSVITIWNTNFRLPDERIYPDRTETYTYDSNAQLIKTQTTTAQ